MSIHYLPSAIDPHLLAMIKARGISCDASGSGGQGYLLKDEGRGLELSCPAIQLTISVDFSQGAARHRRNYGGGRGQSIAKAVGLDKGVSPSVLDATAGMGGDAFVLASLGCDVTLLERVSAVWLLLYDGLRRAREQNDDQQLSVIAQRMHLQEQDAFLYLQKAAAESVDVVYLDPMFPQRKKKSAQVKKEMQIFHSLVGDDADAEKLLEPALHAAKHRVVVKRPRIAPYLAEQAPSYSLEGKSSRFDIYALKKMT